MNLRLRLRNKRAAVSEIMGTIIMVAITLVAGAAVFGWVNGQASTSENAYGQSVANNVNFLKERFVVVSQSFAKSAVGAPCSGGTSPNFQCTYANFWIYNNGQLSFSLYTLRIQNLTDLQPTGNFVNPNPLNVLFYSSCSSTTNCGYVAYNKAGTTPVCSNTAALQGLTNLPQGQLSSAYQVALPANCGTQGQLYLYDGISYIFTFTGVFGNSYATTFTVNG